MKFNYSKLKGRITEICGTRAEFARRMNVSETTLSKKLCGKRAWKQSEIVDALDILGLDYTDIQAYFFTA